MFEIEATWDAIRRLNDSRKVKRLPEFKWVADYYREGGADSLWPQMAFGFDTQTEEFGYSVHLHEMKVLWFPMTAPDILRVYQDVCKLTD